MRNVLVGIGAALLLVPFLPYVAPDNLALFFHGLPVTNLIGGLLVDLLCVAVLVTGFLVALQYLPERIQGVFNALFASFMLWRIVDVAISIQTNHSIAAYWTRARRPSCFVILSLAGLLVWVLPRTVQPVVRATYLFVAAISFSSLWIIPQLLYIASIHAPDERSALLQLPSAMPSNSDRRIVWILFDELSYDQTFEHRASDIRLPNFDGLRTESVSFSTLKPTGFYTQLIIPSLLLGRRIDQIRSTIHGDLWYKYKDISQNRWLAYDPNATLFGLAQQNSWSTGVDGAYIPYCYLLSSVLNACADEPLFVLPLQNYGASEKKSVLANAAVLPSALLAKLTTRTALASDPYQRGFRNVMARIQVLIGNEKVRFVFLHILVPHPPGIYDRQSHSLRSGGTYLDNLVLADDALGSLLREIDATPSASQTTVIVSSDHSWRIPIWRNTEFWSTEEERASGGRFDDRPVLLIHFPGQKPGNDVNAPLPELLEHDIIAGMLRGQINNSEDLTAFLSQHGH
jgi:hypothetical protein